MRVVIPVTAASRKPGLLRSLNCDGWWGPALFAMATLLLLPSAGGEPLRLALRYQRDAIAAGQWWRFVTAHIVHLDLAHALLNATGLVLLWCLFARAWRPRQWLVATGCSMLAIGAGFWWLEPQLRWYVGASGVLHGVFACGCLALLRQRDVTAMIAAPIFVAKLAWEQWQGPLPFEPAGTVVTAAHLYGAIGGAVAGLLLRRPLQQLY